MKLAAAIFDLDGTLIDSEEAWGKVYAKVINSLGANVNEKNSHIFGASVKDNLRRQILEHGLKTGKNLDELEALAFSEFRNLIPEVTLKEGAVEFMEALKENGTPLALATSTNWETADKVLEHFGLLDFFENITTVEEVANPKPAPDIYTLASEKLGIEPADCLVFEDSPAGVISAKEAGMKVVAVNDDGAVQENLKEADLIVDGFSEISLKAIDAIPQD